MKRRISALIALSILAMTSRVSALETNDLVALAAMPLAVAAVSDVADVPPSDLIGLVSAMNRARVPAPQFVEVVRYVPVALIDQREPRFVQYVTTQVNNGLVGDALALSLADRLGTTYGVREINVVNPPAVYYTDRQFIPLVATSRLETQRFDPLSLIAMPLAVAAVASIADVPMNDLVSFISALNQASVPAPQFVEVVRYSPVMFVEEDRPQFIRFVTTEVDRGIRGDALAFAIADRIRTSGIREIDVVRPRRVVFVDRTNFVPPVVRTRVAYRKAHPHGGAPGQLKKDRGVQTGAAIVHQSVPRTRAVARSGRDDDDDKSKKSKSMKGEKRTKSSSQVREHSDERRVTARSRQQPERKASKQSDGRRGGGDSDGKEKSKGKGKKG